MKILIARVLYNAGGDERFVGILISLSVARACVRARFAGSRAYAQRNRKQWGDQVGQPLPPKFSAKLSSVSSALTSRVPAAIGSTSALGDLLVYDPAIEPAADRAADFVSSSPMVLSSRRLIAAASKGDRAALAALLGA